MCFCDWLISLRIGSSRFVHDAAWDMTASPLGLRNIPSCASTTFCLSVHLTGTWVMSTWLLASRCSEHGYTDLVESLLSVGLCLCPEMEVLDQMVILCFIFLRNCHTARLFYTQKNPCIKDVSDLGFRSFTYLAHLSAVQTLSLFPSVPSPWTCVLTQVGEGHLCQEFVSFRFPSCYLPRFWDLGARPGGCAYWPQGLGEERNGLLPG